MMPAVPTDKRNFHQQHTANGHQEIHDCEKNVTPMSLHIGETALQEDVGVIADDGIDARCLVARENHTGKDKRDHVLAA